LISVKAADEDEDEPSSDVLQADSAISAAEKQISGAQN